MAPPTTEETSHPSLADADAVGERAEDIDEDVDVDVDVDMSMYMIAMTRMMSMMKMTLKWLNLACFGKIEINFFC